MKIACVLVFFVIWHFTSFSQTNDANFRQKYIHEIHTDAHQYRAIYPSFDRINKSPPQGKKLSVVQLLTPDSLKAFANRTINKTLPRRPLNGQENERPQNAIVCKDTSFVRLLSTSGTWIYVQKMVPTADDGILISALLYDTTKPAFIKSGYALLIKADELGNVTWIKQFDDPGPVSFFTFFMYNAFELSNKDIICVGSIDTTSVFNNSNTIIYRLDKDGNTIWQKGLHTTLVNTYPQISINVRSVAEGLNGDLLLCGTTESNGIEDQAATIIRLDKSGNIIWDANYGNTGYLEGAEGLAVYFENGKILEVGVSHGSDNPVIPAAIHFLTLDYNTGNLLTKRFFRPNYADKNEEFNKTFTYYYNQCSRLTNGHFIISGKLFSDFTNTTPVTDHFGVVEFDASYNLISSYTISSPLHTNYYNDNLVFNEDGKGLISLFEYINRLNSTLYFGAFANEQFLNQRQVAYSNIALTDPGSFRLTKDNGYIFTQSYFKGGSNSFIEFRKMHNSDTSSACLGKQIFLLQFLPLHIIEDSAYAYLDNNKNKKVQPVNYNFIENDTLQVLNANPCKQTNFCDSIKIHNPPFCGNQAPVLFTVYKNPSCGGIAQWNIDSTAIDSLRPQNDSTVLIYFKNINWQGKLYAALPVGKCIMAMDSLPVTIVKLHTAINLGQDTVLCKGNNMMLHAGSDFIIYKWQDGSTDSIFTVTQPGKYFVYASDKCGNKFSDTINISPADFPFTVGNDTVLCNNIPVKLTATAGFINYKWEPMYNIVADSGQSAIVLPTVDTSYIVTAEKWPGCRFSDTINVRILTSAIVQLGKDTSICSDQSVTLDAGAGFTGYLWNNGAKSRQIIVSQQGNYFVKATAANGCTSSDTLQIINIGPPLFLLGSDTVLCRDTVYTYDFNLPGATYLWNDGSTTNRYGITQPGIYSLTVTQQGCTAKDTVIIGYKNNPVVDLGNDTTICKGNTYLLDATYNTATYAWQDGSTLPDFLVSDPGNYYVAVNLNGCIARDSVHINYLDKPQFTLGGDTSICQGETILLQPHLNESVNYLWQDGSRQSTFAAKDTGVFSLQASNICGSFSNSVVIKAGVCGLMLPNAFTPNGDGINDVFRVRYPFAVKAFILSVFNRFGQKVFETTDISKGWDGTYLGNKQPEGSYVWIVQLTGSNGIKQTSRGVITLIK